MERRRTTRIGSASASKPNEREGEKTSIRQIRGCATQGSSTDDLKSRTRGRREYRVRLAQGIVRNVCSLWQKRRTSTTTRKV